MAALNSHPEFAAARNARAAALIGERGDRMRRRSLIARRGGVDVPPELEAAWRDLKRKKLTNAEAAAALGLKMERGRRARRDQKGRDGRRGGTLRGGDDRGSP